MRQPHWLAALFSIDSLGGGFFVQSLLVLWLYQAYDLSVTTAASLLFWNGLFSAAWRARAGDMGEDVPPWNCEDAITSSRAC
jgi:hypothetical protein